MGLLIDGAWQDQGYDTKSTGGRFIRKDSHEGIVLKIRDLPSMRGAR